MSYNIEKTTLMDIVTTFKTKIDSLRLLMDFMPGVLHGPVEMMDALIQKYENNELVDLREVYNETKDIRRG